MSKNIILLSDGTGNSNIKDRGTNVFKLYEAIDFNSLSPDPREQVAFYDDGVGTQDFKPLKMMGGAFGWGLAQNVRNLYKRLAQAYAPGDRIYLFGFSRGAFTVRSLAGLIAAEGIIDIARYPSDESLDLAVLQLYEGYRAKNTAFMEKLIYKPIMEYFYKAYSTTPVTHPGGGVEIEFIGVWDTVDAVGLPFDEATQIWNKVMFRFKFPDRKLNVKIKKACHALSIDDERKSFHPLLWENDPQRIEQVWFSGVHANVGGGYPQQGISLVALDWMMKKAAAAGIQFVPSDKEFVRDREYVFDKLYDSRAGLGVYYRYKPRDIAVICKDNKITAPQIHVSAFQRIAQGIFGYAPGNLPATFEVVDDDGLHPDSARIQAAVSKEIPSGSNQSPLLFQARNSIRWRQGLYYTFLAYSTFTLYWLLKDDISGKGFWGGLFAAIKILATPDSLLDKLGLLFWDNLWLTGLGLLIFAAAVYFRNKMAKEFSEFWSKLRHVIKALV